MSSTMYIEVGGQIAEIEIPETGHEDDGPWESLAAAYPLSYDHIDEEMVVPTYGGAPHADYGFGPESDADLALWILDGGQEIYRYELQISEGVTITIDRLNGDHIERGTVIWWNRGKKMDVDLTPKDVLKLRLGANPISEGWGNGRGRRICLEQADDIEVEVERKEVTAYKRVRRGGRTLLIYIGEECEKIGVGYGDWVEVTIRKAERHD